jgi:WD40 repeat protein
MMTRIIVAILLMMELAIIPIAAQDVEQPKIVSSMRWSPQGDRLLIMGIRQSKTYGVWLYDTNLQPLMMRPRDEMLTTGWSSDGQRIFIGGDVFDATTFELLFRTESGSKILDWSEDGTELLGWIPYEQIGFFDAQSGKLIRTIDIRDGERIPDQLRWSPNGAYIVLVYGLKSHIISTLDGHLIATLDGKYPNGLSWSPDSRYLAGSIFVEVESGTPHTITYNDSIFASVMVWDATTGKAVQTYSGLADIPFFFHWHPYNGQLVGGSGRGLVYVWDTKTRQQVKAFTLNDELIDFAFSPAGGRLIFSPYLRVGPEGERFVEQRKAFPQSDYWSQDYADGLLKVIVIDPSLENLNDIESRCVPADVIAQLPDAETDTDTYIEAVEQNEAIAPGCAADLVAVAEAMQDQN